jgi:hypothetical protein
MLHEVTRLLVPVLFALSDIRQSRRRDTWASFIATSGSLVVAAAGDD